MANKNIREELLQMRLNEGLSTATPCTEDECRTFAELTANKKQLPKGIAEVESGEEAAFYRIENAGLTDEEQKEYVRLKKLGYLKTIKNCLVFFAALAIIGLASGLIALLLSLFR